ncbi:MAG: globin [Maricaulis sp.]|nr:globin [Maricaulis sp.]
MSSPTPLRETEARAAARAEAAEMGITAELVADLVETFYGHVREDDLLGPVFEKAVAGDWAPHLATMKRFWSSMVFHDGSYSGRPMPAHMKIKADISPDHFTRWLNLFERTLSEIGASEAAQAAFLARAQRIGQSFQMHLFYSPYE